ncbi:MAG: PD-(D/E)XK nuclease family protein, partial [Firmicutes bacterium]|nr:PD-(D/E)XK nuclease family protein [Bacillota bacterium]
MESCELDYDTAAELKAGQEDFGSACELWLIDRSQAALTEEDAAVELPKEASIVLEARLLGLRILSLQKEGYKLKDIAVLVRAAKNHENLLVREFAALGIAAISGSRPNYLQTAEISLVIALLSVIDNPLQELELATVLRSPLYDFSPDELTEIRHIAPKEQLYNAVTLMAERTEELAYKCRHFLEQLNGWRESLRRYRISELIDAIYRESGLFQLAGAWPFGEHRQQNLLFLKEQAREYEAGSYRGLFRFLLFLADGKKKDSMEGGEFADAEDVVHVMSIHRSKGLEFPVVIVANLGGAFALPDEKQDILWHKEFGLGPKMAEAETRRKFPSLAHVAIQRRLHKEAVAEEMRILYVALTRAREKLILSGIVKDIAKTALTWHQQVENQGAILSGALLLNEKNALDWLGQAILRHPHGAKLRQAAGLICGSAQEKQLIIPDDSAWQIKIIAENKLYNLPDLNATNEKDLDTAENLAFMNTTKQEVKAALSYQYPFRETCEAAAKWTVTELNRWQQQFAPATVLEAKTLAPLDNNQSVENIKPAGENTLNSLQAKPAKALRRGTAFHKLLQNLDFATAATKEELQQQLALLVEKEIILAEEAALIEMEKIISFTASQLGKRMAAAKRVIRETPFTYTLPATKLFPTAALKDKLILQGMIDAAFWEEDGWVLLDYKTGGLAYSEQQLKDIYTAQIAYYCQALRNIWQEPLKEAWLYFIDLQKTILVEDW